MKVTVTTLGADDMYTLDVSEDLELENFKALLELESGIPANQMGLLSNAQPMQGAKRKLKEFGIKEGDVLLLQRMQGVQGQGPQASTEGFPMNIDFSSIQIPGQPGPSQRAMVNPNDPSAIRQMLLNSPHDLAVIKERNPPLAEALLSGDLEKFARVLQQQQGERMERERERMRMLTADPYDMDVQRKIEEEIRLRNVEANMESAMEFSPESFGQVVMLYINCEVNGHPVKAFVDSGAQMTIMSQRCAERCNIMRLVDRRWAGIAKGVGTQKIIGRVHLGQIKIGEHFLQSSFSILEEQPMDMLLGLDMLKRHQCCIDLKENVLKIGTTKSTTAFLPEGELPEHARLNRTISQDDDQALAEAMNQSAKEAAASNPNGKNGSASSSSHPSNNASTSAASAAPQTTPASSSRFNEADIKKLVDYGFSRHQVLEELTKADGNVDQALAALFAKSFSVP